MDTEERPTIGRQEKKDILVNYLKEKNTVVPAVKIYLDLTRQINPIEVPELLDELLHEGHVEKDTGFLGYEIKWVYRSS